MASLLSEDNILACIARYFPETHPSLLLGRGDDCAVLRPSEALCVSSDFFLEDVHFRRSYFYPEEIGHKALAVNLSDVAACGARPTGFTLNLGLPEDISLDWLERFLDGMAALAGRCRVALAGGDLSRAASLTISITAWGECARDAYLTRGRAMVGDVLFIVGRVGLARVGLEVLESLGNAARENWPVACAAHLMPEPKVDAGIMLALAGRNARPPALMDISDGIVRDLPRLLGIAPGIASVSGNALGAEVLLPQGILHEEVVRYAAQQGMNPVDMALLGGEDYALLGACAPDMLPALHAALPEFMTIGVVTRSGHIECSNRDWESLRGFDHFG